MIPSDLAAHAAMYWPKCEQVLQRLREKNDATVLANVCPDPGDILLLWMLSGEIVAEILLCSQKKGRAENSNKEIKEIEIEVAS